MGPRRTLGKCKLQTHQSQEPYCHPETNSISEETGHPRRLCFKWCVIYNCRLSAFGRLKWCCICLFFFSPVYTLPTVYSPPNLPLWLQTSSCPSLGSSGVNVRSVMALVCLGDSCSLPSLIWFFLFNTKFLTWSPAISHTLELKDDW